MLPLQSETIINYNNAMIEIEVLNSTDKDQIGVVTFYKDILYVGNDFSCDLYIQDSKLEKSHLVIDISSNFIYLYLQSNVDFIHINNKRYNKSKKIEVNDEIKIGNTVLKIKKFQKDSYKNFKQFLNETTDDLIAQKSPLLNIIELIQQIEK
jgi:hypothetical protein